MWISSIPDRIISAVFCDLKPSIGRMRRLILLWSCSILLLRYLLVRMIQVWDRSCRAQPSVCGRIAGEDSFPICLASVDDNPIRPTMTVESLVEEPLRRGGSRCSVKKNSTYRQRCRWLLEVHPLATDFDMCLIYMPFAGHRSSAIIEPFKQLWRKA